MMKTANLTNNTKLRIALVTDAFKTGGGLEHIFQIAKGLPDFRFGVFARPGAAIKQFEQLPHVEIFTNGYRPNNILRFKPDLIHIHHLKPLLAFYINIFQKHKIPVVFTVHGVHLHKYEFQKGPKSKIAGLLRLRLEKYLLHQVNRIIAVSESDGRFIQTRYSVRNITVIPNGIDLDKPETANSASIADIRKLYELPEDGFLFLTVARFDFAKGYDILVKAISHFRKDPPNRKVMFVFVGGGRRFAQIKQLADQHGLGDLIKFTGEIVPVDPLMKACNVFVLASRWEGLPLTLLEAGLNRMPVIASDTYGIREIIRHGKTGLLFPNGDIGALSNLLLQTAEGKHNLPLLAENLFNLVRTEYGLKKNLEKVRDLYYEMSKPVESR